MKCVGNAPHLIQYFLIPSRRQCAVPVDVGGHKISHLFIRCLVEWKDPGKVKQKYAHEKDKEQVRRVIR